MPSHFKVVCEYGVIHSQCRCPSNDKAIRHITCDISNLHAVQPTGTPMSETQKLHSALRELVDALDGTIKIQSIQGGKTTLVNAYNQACELLDSYDA